MSPEWLRPQRRAGPDHHFRLRQHSSNGDLAGKIGEPVVAPIFGSDRSDKWNSGILRRGPAVDRKVVQFSASRRTPDRKCVQRRINIQEEKFRRFSRLVAEDRNQNLRISNTGIHHNFADLRQIIFLGNGSTIAGDKIE